MSNQVDDYIIPPVSPGITIKPAQKTAAQEALETVEDRQAKYGPPDENFATIADLWSNYLGRCGVIAQSDSLSTQQVAMMMLLVKVAREAHQHQHDNIVDIIGYAECYDRLGG